MMKVINSMLMLPLATRPHCLNVLFKMGHGLPSRWRDSETQLAFDLLQNI
jgi:hypothetical protein